MRIPTNPSAAISDFLTFLAACNQGLPDALRGRGADDAAIAKLAAESGFALPPFYVDFLKEFGEDTGHTHVGGDGFATVEVLLEHYDDPVEMKMTPPGGVVISASGLMPNRMLVPLEGQEEAAVACFTDAKIDYFISRSFGHLLYQETWIYARFVDKNKHVTSHSKDTGLVAKTAAAFAGMGLEPYWFSDQFGVYCESDNAFACARADDQATTVWIGSESVPVRERLRNDLRTQLGFLDERDFARTKKT